MENSSKERKIPPTLYSSKVYCCGCSACYSICPKSAITMKQDEEGFDYPVIDDTKCIGCLLCLKACPFKDTVCL